MHRPYKIMQTHDMTSRLQMLVPYHSCVYDA